MAYLFQCVTLRLSNAVGQGAHFGSIVIMATDMHCYNEVILETAHTRGLSSCPNSRTQGAVALRFRTVLRRTINTNIAYVIFIVFHTSAADR